VIIETIVVGGLKANCYIVAQGPGSDAAIIDPGGEEDKIKKVLSRIRAVPVMIINTHGHIDHIGSDDKFAVPVYIHEKDMDLLKDPQRNLSSFLGDAFSVKAGREIRPLKDNDRISLEGIEFKVIHVPGHSPGGICLLLEGTKPPSLFTGDSLFYGSVGRTDFPGASEDALLRSLKEKILTLSPETVIYPGHGPASTLGEEIKNNPFLR